MAFPLQLLPSSSSPLAFRHSTVSTNPTKASSLSHKTTKLHKSIQLPNWVSGIRSKSLNFLLSGSLALALSLTGQVHRKDLNFVGVGFAEGKAGVNKPELLPKEFTTVIDVAGFLSDGQGEDASIEAAVMAISSCLREPVEISTKPLKLDLDNGFNEIWRL
ncbi:hypothetical protein RD792_011968 [Penstemon davidsonii]|uniref:Uncharacterized protein n=1 Tax=Penstemon davidsonii TaxID=160366 RepID=A0ABR0CW00_9LAMI|nr:hypothetical protein RD792_011968 [Penstemon davidsonii]